MALTVGLLAFLAVDATLEGLELAGEGSQAFGGAALVFMGAGVAYLFLAGVSAWLGRRAAAGSAVLVAFGIGLHNLGEGVAIGAAYSAGALALGAFLVIGFAIHNTTEGLGDRRAAWRASARRWASSPGWACSRAGRRCSARGSARAPTTRRSRRSCSASARARSCR